MILYDKFYAFRFASAHMVDLDWGGGCWTVVVATMTRYCAHRSRHGDQEKFPNHGVCLCSGARRTFRHDVWPGTRQIEKTAVLIGRRIPQGYKRRREERGWHLSGSDNLEGDDLLGLMATPQDIIVSGDKGDDLAGTALQRSRSCEGHEVGSGRGFLQTDLVGDSAITIPAAWNRRQEQAIPQRDWLTARSERDLWAVCARRLSEGWPDGTGRRHAGTLCANTTHR